MSWEDEDIDQLFRDSAKQIDVPFQDAFWDEMEAMLPQKKKKKGFFWIFRTSFTVIAAVIAGTFLFPTQRPVSAKLKSVSEVKSTPTDVVAISPIAQTTSLETNKTTDTNVDEKTQHAHFKSNDQASRFENRASKNPFLTEGAISAHTSSNTGKINPPLLKSFTSQNTENQSESEIRLPFRSMSTSIGLQPSKNIEMQLKNRRDNPWFLQLNAGIAQAYLRDASTVSPTFSIGIGYQKQVVNLAFSAGLQVQNMFVNSLEITRTSRVYHFASTTYEQKIQIKQLYTLEIPLAVSMIKNRHTFSVGLTPGYLIGSLVKVREFENGSLEQQNNYLGQRIGLKSMSLKPHVGYQMQVNKAWQVGIQIQTQLLDQIDLTPFAGEARKFPLTGQFTIRKTLF